MTEIELDEDLFYALLLIKVLGDTGVSFVQMTRIFKLCSETDKTLKSKYVMALEINKSGGFRDYPKGRRGIDLRYVGDSRDVEYVDACEYHSECGGGRKVRQNYEE